MMIVRDKHPIELRKILLVGKIDIHNVPLVMTGISPYATTKTFTGLN